MHVINPVEGFHVDRLFLGTARFSVGGCLLFFFFA